MFKRKLAPQIALIVSSIVLVFGPLSSSNLMAEISSVNQSRLQLADLSHSPGMYVTQLPPGEYLGMLRRQMVAVGTRYQIDPLLLECLIKQESGFRWNARSPKGALGLCQFMPGTAERFGLSAHSGSGDGRLDPLASIEACGRYLRFLLDLFGGRADLAVAAYNCGEGRVLRNGMKVPNIDETQGYLAAIRANYLGSGGRYHRFEGEAIPIVASPLTQVQRARKTTRTRQASVMPPSLPSGPTPEQIEADRMATERLKMQLGQSGIIHIK